MNGRFFVVEGNNTLFSHRTAKECWRFWLNLNFDRRQTIKVLHKRIEGGNEIVTVLKMD